LRKHDPRSHAHGRVARRDRRGRQGRGRGGEGAERRAINRMSTAPRISLDVGDLWSDPYPAYARLRREAPIAFVPELGSTLLTRRDDIYVCEKHVAVFSSHQPQGLMN